jgi:hypothetical protein
MHLFYSVRNFIFVSTTAKSSALNTRKVFCVKRVPSNILLLLLLDPYLLSFYITVHFVSCILSAVRFLSSNIRINVSIYNNLYCLNTYSTYRDCCGPLISE